MKKEKLEEKISRISHELEERVKELRCIYGMADLVEKPEITLDEIFRGTVKLIPPAWQYPKIAYTRAKFLDKEFKTKNFKQTPWKMTSGIFARGKKIGSLEVGYLKKTPKSRKSHFLKEEKKLLNSLAERLGKITEKKWAEDDVRRSEMKFRQFFENDPNYCYMVSPQGKILDINDEALKALGYSKKEVIGKPLITALYAPSSRKKVRKLFDRWKKTGEIRNEELKVMTKSGEERTVILNVDSVRDAKSNILHSISEQLDITDRKNAEQALRESENHFRTLVSNIPGIVYRCANDPEWTIQFVSDPIYEVSGYPSADFIGNRVRSYASVIHPDDRAMVEEAVSRGVKRKQTYIIEYRIVRNDGTIRWVHEKGRGVFGDNGDLLWLDGAIFDITERKKIDELKDEFVNTVSHELRTPLAIIRESSYFLALSMEKTADEKQKRHFDILRRNVDRLEHLVGNVLDYQRLTAGRMGFDLKKDDVNVLVKDAKKELLTLAEEKGIELDVKPAKNLPKVKYDADRVM
ncbi:MAG: PAS domain S-box protein, partial [Candidatus Omnitrophota bacterium]